MNTKRKASGFTLLEVLIASAILGVMYTMYFVKSSQVNDVRARLEDTTDQLVELQLGFFTIGQDIQHSVARPVRDIYGEAIPAIRGSSINEMQIELTRTGHRNPIRLQRSSLQRVAYILEDETLYRVNWPVLDRSQSTEPTRVELIHNIKSLEIQFLSSKDKWLTDWPPYSDKPQLNQFPRAINISMEFEDMGKINRVFVLPEASL
jgi:general secretion pathway protein J